MRIWHQQLIPRLCRKHLLAVWREGLGAYKIITENKKGYRNHPAVKEFEGAPNHLLLRLIAIHDEMVKRGYHPKDTPDADWSSPLFYEQVKPWQTLEEQIKVLKSKKCDCKI